MIGRLALLLVLAIGLVAAQVYKPDYLNEVTADKDFLLKQKKIYQILWHFWQPEIKTELYKEGQEYSIEANKDSYTNKDAVNEFLHRFEHGFLPHDAIYSIFYKRNIDETAAVFRLFYYAKDFDTFYKTALFCRNRINHYVFFTALYAAVLHRPDTKYIKLPPLYEIVPNFFYNRELLEKAHHFKEFGKFEAKHSASFDAYIIPYNYSNFYLTDEYDYEQRLNYFTEDVGLNNYYYFFRDQFPFYLKSEDFGLPKNYRGEEYLYGHKQLFTRYYLERLSNDLGKVEDYDYSKQFYPGYWPSLSYPNGLQFPSRPANSFLPKKKYHKIWALKEYETRIGQAVDSGIVFTKAGKPASISTPDGLNTLGNLIEGNADSCNNIYYGSVDKLSRHIFGFGLDPLSSTKLFPSALEQFTTSLRDPAFWRIYKRILHFYYKYKWNQKPYKPEEIQYPELKIESVSTDKLETYFDYYDTTISNGLAVSSEQEAESYVIQARQYRLNHKHFNVYINVNAEKATKAAIRIFLGPKLNVHNKEYDFQYRYRDFYEMDNFIYDLSAGANKIERNCHDFFFVEGDNEPSEVYWKKILKAIEGGEELKYQKRILGFPQRLLLPKGKPEGMPFQLFIHIAPVQGEPLSYTSRVFGDSLVDNRPFGYPLDRPFEEYNFHGPNFFFTDVLIYHKLEHDQHVSH